MPKKYQLPKLYEQEKHDINAQLHLAVEFHDLKAIEYLVDEGADPFKTPKDKPKTPSKKQRNPAFSLALHLGRDKIVSLFLKNLKKPFDFSQPHPEFSKRNFNTINWLQYACLFSSTDCVEQVLEYQKHGPFNKNIREILNRKFYFTLNSGHDVFTTLGSILLWMFSVTTLHSNKNCYNWDRQQAKAFLTYWKGIPSSCVFKPNSPIPSDAKVKLINIMTIDLLLRNDYLNLEERDHNNKTMPQLAWILLNASQNVETWQNNIMPNIVWHRFRPIGDPQTFIDGQKRMVSIPVEATTCAGEGAHPIKLTIVPYPEAVVKKLDPEGYAAKFGAKDSPPQTPTHPDVAALAERQNQLEEHLRNLSEHKYNQALEKLKSYPFHRTLFIRLHEKIVLYITARKMGALNIIQTKPSKSLLRNAQTFMNCVNTAAALAPVPFVTFVTELGKELIAIASDHSNRKTNRNVANLPVNSTNLATIACAWLVMECMATYGQNPDSNSSMTARNIYKNKIVDMDALVKDLFAKIQKRIDGYRSNSPGDISEAEVALNIVIDAVNLLRQRRGEASEISAPSISYASTQSTDSDEYPKLPYQAPRAVSGGCCVIS